ncbi:interleukin-22-like [Mobula birostris]|uniref:interleukin-22-like n=1 Tax=Mobula birostris TaxID=1983395 RepID=UPI003B27B5C8
MRHKFHVLSKDAQKHDEDTETRLVGKDLFRGLEKSGSCYVLKEVIDFYLGTVLQSDHLHAKYLHLSDVKEFLAVLMKRHMSDCDTEDKTKANKNIERLKQKVEKLGEASEAKVVGELFILLQEITSRCSTPGWKPGHQGKSPIDN